MDVYSTNTTVFIANIAYSYGGAVYVDDDTNSGICTGSSNTECFFQVLAISHLNHYLEGTQSMFYTKSSDLTLYGGLLDRCAINEFAAVPFKYESHFNGVAIAYFKNVSVTTYETTDGEEVFIVSGNAILSSAPVKVCL